MKKTISKTFWILICAFVLVSFYVVLYYPEIIVSGKVGAAEKFDHSNCQYPNRNTNPPNGCDNSDPACPETIKFGYDCEEFQITPVQPEVVGVETPVQYESELNVTDGIGK